MIIDLSCPIELRGYELLHDDTGSVRAYIDLFNVSDLTVTAYAGTVRWSRDETQQGANDTVNVDCLAIPGGSRFRLSLSSSLVKYADRLEIYFSRVCFEGAPDWTPRDGDLVNVGEQHALEGAELTRLRRTAGEDALMYPETQDEYWRCVCGRINPLSLDECARCRRERSHVLTDLSRKTVSMTTDERFRRAVRQNRAAHSRSRVPDAGRRTKWYIALMFLACAGFLALAAYVGLQG
ncbi:MAG: hypothetical protein IKX84_02585 [Clostridia bacterium]|nr:hypothetical protein [Clostridia bacterium]